MKNIFKMITKPLNQTKYPYLYTVATVAITVILTFLFSNVYFETNDAGRMMYQMAGYYTGEVEPITNFVGIPFCTFVTMLYTINANIPWFSYVICATYILAYLLMAVSMTKILIKNNGNILQWFFLILTTYTCAILYPITHLHVYYSVVVLGTSLACMLLSVDFENDSLFHYVSYFLIGLLYMFLCFSLGFSATVCSLVFISITLFFHATQLFKKHKKQLILLALASITVVGVGYTAYSVSTNIKNSERPEYTEYNKYRVNFTDYPHVSYDEDPQLYESIGWSQALYNLAEENHYLMDEKINADNLSQIVNERKRVNLDFGEFNIIEVLYDAKTTLFDNVTTSFIVYMMIVMFAVTFIYQLITGKWKNVSLWLSYACCAVAVALIIYLCLNGRFLKRVALTVIIPASITQLYLVVKSIEFGNDDKKWSRVLLCLFLIPCLLGGYSGVDSVINYSTVNYIRRVSKVNRVIENYVQDHQDNIYIYGIELMSIREPFVTYEKGALKNLFNYGTAYTYTPTFYKQVNINGHDDLNSDSFLKDDVYYLASKPTSKYTFNLINYLMEEYNIIGFEVIENVDNMFYVLKPYKLPLENENFTGVVNALDKSYYVKNGKIQEGQIDGYETTISEKVVDVLSGEKTYFISTQGWIKIAES